MNAGWRTARSPVHGLDLTLFMQIFLNPFARSDLCLLHYMSTMSSSARVSNRRKSSSILMWERRTSHLGDFMPVPRKDVVPPSESTNGGQIWKNRVLLYLLFLFATQALSITISFPNIVYVPLLQPQLFIFYPCPLNGLFSHQLLIPHVSLCYCANYPANVKLAR